MKTPTTITDKWSDLRENLRKHAEKFPATLIDVIDSAYLAGLEAKNPDLKSIHEKVEAAALERGKEEGMKLLRGEVIKLAKAEGAAAEREAITKIVQKKISRLKGGEGHFQTSSILNDVQKSITARTTTPPGEK